MGGFHHNKKRKVLNTEEHNRTKYPNNSLGVKIIRRIAGRINGSERKRKRIRERRESNGRQTG